MRLNVKTAFVNQAFWFTNAAIWIAAFVNQSAWFTNAVIQIAAFVNQINLKNATAFFTNAFKRWAALNKERSFIIFVLVSFDPILFKMDENKLHFVDGGFYK